MKNALLTLFAAIALFGCTEKKSPSAAPSAEVPVAEAASTYSLDPAVTLLSWKAAKVTGEHMGNVPVSSGKLGVNGADIVSGSFEIDLGQITVTDVADPGINAKLVGHLKSEDFFASEIYPKGSFVLTKVAPLKGDSAHSHTITGNLTLKNISREITFPAKISLSPSQIIAEADRIVLDRTWWDIRYRSGKFFPNLGDKLIKDEFTLSLYLVVNLESAVALGE